MKLFHQNFSAPKWETYFVQVLDEEKMLHLDKV